jgi:serine/threonine protein kinase
VKLVDFGSACFQNRTVYQYIQSRFYRSPEVFLGMPYGMPIDMWSLGCVAAELFLGLPIFPGSSEYDLLSRICETIGTPPANMLAKASNTNKFFTRVDIGFDESSSSLASSSGGGTSRYKLLSLREFEARSGRRAAMGKKYFKYTEFSDIIASIPYQSSKVDPNDQAAVDAEKKARMVERSAFYDLLTGMMEIDPTLRWTPAQALKHPFITGEPFDEPYAPKHIPERTTPEEREELQRVAAKEAAKISSGEPVKKKKKPIPRDFLPMDVVPPTPPANPVGGLAAAFAASSASGSVSSTQPVTPNVLNPVVAEAFSGAMLQAQAAAHAQAAAAVAAMSPGGIPMSPGGGVGGGYPPFVVGSSGGSFNSPSSLLSGSFIGSPHATNSAAMHPLHFGVSPPTHQLSTMGLSTSHATRAAQAAAAVQLPPASPLGPRGTAFARGMDARYAKPGTSFQGSGVGTWSASASASASRDNLKTLQTVHESMISPPVASPSPVDEDHAEGADWDPTFGEMDDLEMEDTPSRKQTTATATIAMPTRRAIPPVVNPLSSADAFPVGSAPVFASGSQFSVSPNSAFATKQSKPSRRKSSKDKAGDDAGKK